MSIHNQNIKNALRTVIGIMVVVAVIDVIIANTSGSLGAFFKGYSAVIFPVMVVATYAYLGIPIFNFDSDSEVLHIQSHFALGRLFGKELYVPKANIVSFSIDRKRIRKRLTIRYIKNGHEFSEKFGISLLGNKKIEELARQVELIQSTKDTQSGTHLFI
ncbi:hypothetical protein [Owenweeksia hongkongensis]|uniref:hypothetical protein n=1 Tax=Owenweeksia hongkongensis TaxID=253245 RepID=UPI003A8CA005